MMNIRTFIVVPVLPTKLQPLKEIAYNLWWSWNRDAVDLFYRLDPELWEQTQHNPVRLLGAIDQRRLVEAAQDDGYLLHLERVWRALKAYMAEPTWYEKHHDEKDRGTIAYFSAEFGISECLPIYSGGLGILAGDHLKSASDLGIPLVGMGLLYREGYFRQYLNADGWQQEMYPDNDFFTMPVQPCCDDAGKQVVIDVPYPTGPVKAQLWYAQIGRVRLFLLDANVPQNRPEDRQITAQLYGGDLEMRIRQEILLGVGGIRALAAMGIRPAVCHMNEGHSAFLALERIRELMQQRNLPFEQAKIIVAAGNVFTTHTPVPAGNDTFPPALMDKYFSNYYPALGLTRKEFLALGRQNPNDDNEPFCMTVLALKMASHSNGVSRLHGKVSRRLWRNVWPGVPEEEIPITSVTNGIHIASWISGDMANLLDRYLGPKWRDDPSNPDVWDNVHNIPNAELWRTHERRRERLVAFARQRLKRQLIRRGATKAEINQAEEALDPDALTIGFARRFATYKRGTLLLRDPKRLERILCDKDRPVQIIFAGKAHPRDNAGKQLIREIIHFARKEPFRRRIVFLEDYDMTLARYLVQGVDVWLNTPRRPLEASGTSGMKVAANGGLNFSILDGWWCEGYNQDNGWAIGNGEEYEDIDYQDEVESNAAYDVLEKEIMPLFYKISRDGLPRGWISMMKASMSSLARQFNTNRMVQEYTERAYIPCREGWRRLSGVDDKLAAELAEWHSHLRQHWNNIRIAQVATDGETMSVGSQLLVQAHVYLGPLSPDDVAVEIYQGPVDADGNITNASAIRMSCVQTDVDGKGTHLFTGAIPCRTSGRQGYALRVLPKHDAMPCPYIPGLIK